MLLRLVPAREREPGVPVEIPGVRPVAAQHALQPRADRRDLGGIQRRHARLPGAVVEHHGLGDDRRVLGAVEVHRMPVRVLRQVVPVVTGPGERDAPGRHGTGQSAREAAELRAAVVAQQPLVAGDVGGRRVDLDRPVDLVEPKRRVEVEGVIGRRAHVLPDVRGLGRRQADLLSGQVRHGQSADHGRVDHRVLSGRRAHRRAPAPVVRLIARRAGVPARGARGGAAMAAALAPTGTRHGGSSSSRRASARARASSRQAPWWPARAAAACRYRRFALTDVSPPPARRSAGVPASSTGRASARPGLRRPSSPRRQTRRSPPPRRPSGATPAVRPAA